MKIKIILFYKESVFCDPFFHFDWYLKRVNAYCNNAEQQPFDPISK